METIIMCTSSIHKAWRNLALLVVFSLIHAQDQILQPVTTSTTASCPLCEDGSSPTAPNGKISLYQDEWSCQDLAQILDIIGVPDGSSDCQDLQFRAFRNCGCPTFPQGVYCSLCPGGSTNLPYPTQAIPSIAFGGASLTCQDILFSRRDSENVIITCDEMERYQNLCRCPKACSLCPYNDETPEYSSRILPFFSKPGGPSVTCASHADQIARAPPDRCEEYRQAPVPVDVAAYCGCPMTQAANACSLCPSPMTIINPDLVIPRAGGMTCQQLQEYLPYITDPTKCQTIASLAQACCHSWEPCPICADGTNGLGSSKIYQPYDLSCDRLGGASQLGYPLSCETAKQRFAYFCRCPGANPDCTVCGRGQLPPFPDRYIPLLNVTCGTINDFVSLRTWEECQSTLASFSIDVAAYCGCNQNFSPRGRCNLCGPGEELVTPPIPDDNPSSVTLFPTLAPSLSSTSSSIFTSRQQQQQQQQLATTSITSPDYCGQLADFAQYVMKTELCSVVQESSSICCRPVVEEEDVQDAGDDELDDIETGFPILQTTAPSFTFGNFTNTTWPPSNESFTLSPTTFPLPLTPVPAPAQEQSGTSRTNNWMKYSTILWMSKLMVHDLLVGWMI